MVNYTYQGKNRDTARATDVRIIFEIKLYFSGINILKSFKLPQFFPTN